MELRKLLSGIDIIEKIYGNTNIDITSIANDSRKVKKGGLFIAIKGFTVDGHDFVPQATNNGVFVVVGEKYPKKSWGNNFTYIKVRNSRKALGMIASNWYRNPSEKLKVIGVTGTKGKTTTVHMITHILNKIGKKTCCISSVNYPGLHVTNPGSIELNKYLNKFYLNGCKYAVIEVSSHGIDQQRIAGINFKIGVLTNIAPEHLDYHKTFENYKKTKMNFIGNCEKKILCPRKTNIDLFPGKFNNLNAEAAVRTVELLGIEKGTALSALCSFKLPKGRLEEIRNNRGIRIFIDFAHTPESLKEVLKYLKTITKGRLVAIFGCAGERDKNKRVKMGEISTKLADISIFTAEDPRSEKVEDIINAIEKGVLKAKVKFININQINRYFHDRGKNIYLKIPERGDAISFAINKLATKGDTVVICGKGHEKSMACNGVEYEWSDQKAVQFALMGKVLDINRN